MKAPESFSRVVNKMRYDVKTATLIAHDAYWDGHNFERSGRNTYLYRTPNGHYFEVTLTCWQGELDALTPLSLEEAIDLYENCLPEHEESYQDAFPGVKVQEA